MAQICSNITFLSCDEPFNRYLLLQKSIFFANDNMGIIGQQKSSSLNSETISCMPMITTHYWKCWHIESQCLHRQPGEWEPQKDFRASTEQLVFVMNWKYQIPFHWEPELKQILYHLRVAQKIIKSSGKWNTHFLKNWPKKISVDGRMLKVLLKLLKGTPRWKL